MASFQWHPDDRPPQIEPHSKAKLELLRAYLRAYFDRMDINPKREEIKLDLVDGFAGGGTFQDGDKVLSGSPLVMLEEAEAARERLNKKRNKTLKIKCGFYFIDKEKPHTDHLHKALTERGYKIGQEIKIETGLFEDNVEKIIQSIREKQPRAGRAIFLLDQTGFSSVKLDLVRRIFSALATAEVILTFAADALVNHLAKTPQVIKMAAPIELTESQIHDLIEYRNSDGGRALIQRTLRSRIRSSVTQAEYDTPFFIRPAVSRRALWFIHLSRHPTARDVMIQQHWNIQNTFQHYGTGGFGMLGWDTLKDSKTLPLFQFRELDEETMQEQLLKTLPGKLFSLASEQPVTIDAIHHVFANQTAARFSDLDKIVLQLVKEGEFDILDANGKARSRSLKILKHIDQITLPSTPLIPGLSRLC